MDQKKIVNEPKYHGVLVDTMAIQVLIKQTILNDLSKDVAESKTKEKVKKQISDFCANIEDSTYRARARTALANSFANWYKETALAFGMLPFLLLQKFRNVPQKIQSDAERKLLKLPTRNTARIADITPQNEYGREWHDNEYRQSLKKAYSRYIAKLSDNEAKYDRNVSLRNLAEVEVRRGEIQSMISRLRAQGVKYAWCSTHADCSIRCSKWQGRLYSLDGTSGIIDGIPYIPIEVAINVVDKYGNINGLFGYNCRHRLIPYVKYSQPPKDYSEREMALERLIDVRQRELEKTVRKWKIRGYLLKNQDKEASNHAFQKAREWTSIYENFSHSNGRAFYRERIQVMTEEIEYTKQIG